MLSKSQITTIPNHYLVNILALFFFIITTAIAGRPVLSSLDTVIIGDDPDVYINPWADWWTLRAWQDPNIDLWHTDYLFFPEGANLTFHSFSHLNTLVSLIMRPFLGALPAYNLMVLLNLVLIGFAMFQLAHYLTCSFIASIIAGIVFAFNTNSLYETSHPVLLSVWCFPWATLYFMRAVRENQIKWAIIAAVFIFLGTATSTLLTILLAMWFTFLIIYIFISPAWPHPSWPILLTLVGVSNLLILPLLYPLLKDAILNRNESFIISGYLTFSTDITAIFIPHWLRWTTRGVYLGIVSTYLAVLAYSHQRRQVWPWLLLTIIAFLFMIGPDPTFAGHELGITLPWSALITPVLRSPYRISILMAFGFAMVVAYGWLALATRFKTDNMRIAAAVIVILTIYIEFTISTTHATPVQVSTFYSQYLDNVPDDIALAILPTGRQVDKLQLYYQTIHGHKMTGGVVSRTSPTTFNFIYSNPLLRAGAVDLAPVPIPVDVTSALQDLAARHIGYLILDKTLLDDVEAWRAKIPDEPIFEDELLLVYSTGLPIPFLTPPTTSLPEAN